MLSSTFPLRSTASAEWILAILLIAVCGGRTLLHAWQSVNTDFPNYYLTARLVHEKADTTRIYEWTWLQRQKDHRSIDQPLVALGAVTPISTLAVYPFAGFAPLAAKRCWLVLNVALLLWTIYLLANLTGLPRRRIVLLAAVSIPLWRNLLYGQYYVPLLFLLSLACLLYRREKNVLSGLVVSIAIALKIFPFLYLIYFLRKRDWKAAAGCISGLAVLAGASLAVFSWQLNRIYLQQVLPSALRGESLNPYLLSSASISSLLHHLFLYEPQWNPHPVLHAPLLFAVLQPFAQMLVLAPALLFINPSKDSQNILRAEWALILLAALAISTNPASYHFTLLILPVALLLGLLAEQLQYKAIAILIALYLVAGHSFGIVSDTAGWRALLGVPRLYTMLLLCLFAGWTLLRLQPEQPSLKDAARIPWSIALALVLLLSICAGVHHQRGLYSDYAYRIPLANQYMLTGYASPTGNTLHAIALVPHGYRAIAIDFDNPESAEIPLLPDHPHGADELSLAAGGDQLWIEETGAHSTLVAGENAIADAEAPVLSADRRHLAYLREQSGRSRLWLHDLSQPPSADYPVMPLAFNVFEATFAPNGNLVFSAMKDGAQSALFLVNNSGTIVPLLSSESRYPAISPDGHWLAYSRMQHGNWNLWLADLHAGTEKRLTDAECNFTEPSWQADSQTLLYASDCGRAPGLTALSQRRVVQ